MLASRSILLVVIGLLVEFMAKVSTNTSASPGTLQGVLQGVERAQAMSPTRLCSTALSKLPPISTSTASADGATTEGEANLKRQHCAVFLQNASSELESVMKHLQGEVCV